MKKEIITSEKLRKPHGIYSPAVKVKADHLLFIKGTTSRDRYGNIVGKGDIKAQTRQILENITIDEIVKSPTTCHCEERSDEAIP